MAAERSCIGVLVQQLNIFAKINRESQGLCQAYAMGHGTLRIYWRSQKHSICSKAPAL